MAQPARHSERAEKLYPPAIQSSASLHYEDHVIMRERLLKLMRRDDELISASLRALSETRELLARIDDMLDR